MKCPVCHNGGYSSALNKWKFNEYDVTAFNALSANQSTMPLEISGKTKYTAKKVLMHCFQPWVLFTQ